MTRQKLQVRLAAILAADAVAYSRLMSADARATIEALEVARETFRTISAAHEGRVVDTAGDSVLAIFGTAAGATAAALEIQQQLEAHAQGIHEDRRLRFRIGLHLGDVMQTVDGSVYGDGVNVAARLQSTALAGGIVASESIWLAVRGKVTAAFESLGDHALKNIAEPVRAHRVLAAQASVRLPCVNAPPAERTPPAAPRAAGGSALPAYFTRLIGAEAQAAALRDLVSRQRLVTLLGPGGTGKTRLAVETVQAWPATLPPFDTVAFVPLAGCRTRAQMLDQLLMALQLGAGPAGALTTLVQALDGRRALLILDNFEQLVEEGADVIAELGARLPALHQLVTSRRALTLDGERALLAAALPLPAADAALDEAEVNPGVALFVDRARAARDDFELHDGNRAAVVELVRGLEGMPLAIELAAARVRSFAPAEMAQLLARARGGAGDDEPGIGALDLLARAPVRGRRDTRHHSMQETIDWSWQLLTPELRALLALCTVFHGGFTAAAVQAVLATQAVQTVRSGGSAAVALQLDELLSHSLLRALPVQPDSGAARFSLYEPIREFAARKLDATETAALRQRQRRWALAWSERMPATPPVAALWVEMPNLLAAMASAVADGDPLLALDIALALRPALDYATLPGQGQAAIEAALTVCSDPVRHSAGMTLLGLARFRSGRREDGNRLIEQALAAAPPDVPGVGARARVAAVVLAFNSGTRGPALRALADAAQAAVAAAGERHLNARMNGVLADVVGLSDGDFAQAERLHQQALTEWLALGDELAVLRTRYSLAQLARMNQRHALALQQISPVIAAARRLQSWVLLAPALALQADAQVNVGLWAEAAATAREAVRTSWRALDQWNAVLPMWTLHMCLARASRQAQAQQLAGFLAQFWTARFGPLNPAMQSGLRRTRRLAQVGLGGAAAAQAFADGAALSVADAVALVLSA